MRQVKFANSEEVEEEEEEDELDGTIPAGHTSSATDVRFANTTPPAEQSLSYTAPGEIQMVTSMSVIVDVGVGVDVDVDVDADAALRTTVAACVSVRQGASADAQLRAMSLPVWLDTYRVSDGAAADA